MNPFVNCLVAAYYIRKRLRIKRKRYHVHPIPTQKLLKEEFTILFSTLRENEENFFNYFRLSTRSFDELLAKLQDHLKHCNIYRVPVAPKERLAITLRYLSSGATFTNLHYNYRLGVATIRGIVIEVCTKIWEIFQEECLSLPSSSKEWLSIADSFEHHANFPNCIGAIDGKHVRIICPEHSRSLRCNYKKHFSIVLRAMCDTNYRFTYINVSCCETDSNSSLLKESSLFTKFQNKEINLPHPRPLPNTNSESLPYIIIGDATFGISNRILRPYARSNMTHKKKIFNYRLSRARRYIQSTFGIMTNKFRIFHKPMNTSLETTIKIVKACCVLHNFIRDRDGYNIDDTFTILGLETNNSSANLTNRTNNTLRDKFAKYFISAEGTVPWQDRCI